MASGPRVPGYSITNVDESMASFVRRLVIDYASDGPDMFDITFTNQTAEEQTKPTFTDGGGMFASKFKEGDEITIQVGYDSKMTKMIVGEITGVEAIFKEDEPSQFSVRGFDKLHRLSRGKKQRTFLNMKDSQIAQQIAGEMGLSAEVDDSAIVHDHVFQNNLSDIDFLYSRARGINFEVDVQDTKLLFKKPQVTGSSVATLKWEDNIRKVRFYLSTAFQVSEVQVRGWSTKDKKEIVGKASSSDVYSKMGGDKSGGEVATGKYGQGKIVTVVTSDPLQTQEEADAIAKARLNELSLNFITGEAIVEGDAAIKSNAIVEFQGVGKKFEGQYYVVNAVHTIRPGNDKQNGYTTRFTFKRAGVKQM